jgi:hypothetical protein
MAYRCVVVACLLSGCGFPLLQTARTVPPGRTQVTIGKTVLSSDLRNRREPPSLEPQVAGVSNPILGPLEIALRRGITAQVDVGARLFFGPGLLLDAKLNLLPSRLPVALAIAAGVGGAIGPTEDSPRASYYLGVPVSLLASVDAVSGLRPYAGIGYRGVWMWGSDDPTLAGTSYTTPDGRGEGLLLSSLGIDLGHADGWGVLLEYGYLAPLWHDPGQGYQFVSTHIIAIGLRIGPGAAFAR